MYEHFDRIRQEKGLSVYEVSRRSGIAQSTLSMWKNGKTKVLGAENMQKLADVLEVPVEYLLTGDAEPKHYEDPLTAELAQRMMNDHDMRLLFSAAKDAKPETLQAVYDVLLALKKRERNEE